MQLSTTAFKNAVKLLAPILVWAISAGSVIAQPDRGAQLIDKYGCRHCHVINGTGSFLAPPLDGIGRHRNVGYIQDRLSGHKGKSTSAYPVPSEIMNHVTVPATDAKLLADYLSKLPDIKFPQFEHATDTGVVPPESPAGSRFVPQSASDSSARGAMLYKDKGCIACHTIGTTGGTIGPNLSGVGARRSRNFIKTRIGTGAISLPKPGEPSGGFAMPNLKLKESETEDLTNWLLTLPASK